jgi:hypothetical protein
MMQQETVMKKFLNLTLAFAMLISLAVYGTAQKKAKAGRVCGDPTVACKNRTNFQPNDLPFDTGKNFVIAESEPFYAMFLKVGSAIIPPAKRHFRNPSGCPSRNFSHITWYLHRAAASRATTTMTALQQAPRTLLFMREGRRPRPMLF